MKNLRPGARAAGTLAALALGALTIQSCGDKESLVVVSLTASPANADLDTVTIGLASVSKTFTIATGGLDANATIFGVYVPSSVTGSNILVAATAKAGSAPGCYQGRSNDTNIPSAGATVSTSIVLEPSKSCGGATGAGGSGSSAMGSAGAGGAAGAGGSGAAGAGGTTGAAGAGGTMGTAGAGGTTGAAGAGGTMGTAGAGGTVGTAGAGGTMGTAGAGGTMGTAGAGGMGGTGQVITPPSLTKCTEYEHSVDNCVNEGDAGDWSVWSVAFSPDGKLLLSGGQDGRVKVWSMNGTVPVAEGHEIATDGQAYIAFSADGTRLAVGSNNGQFTIHNTATWAIVGTPTGQTGHIEGVGFSADGTKVFAADFDGILTVHTVGTDAPTKIVNLPDAAYTLSVSPVQSATALWVGVGYSNGFADVLNFAGASVNPTMALSVTIDAGTTLAYSTFSSAFSPDGKTFATGGEDGVTSFWSLPLAAAPMPVGTTITSTDSQQNPLAVNGMMFSSDSRYITAAVGTSFDGGRLGVWDVASRGTRGAKVPTFYAAVDRVVAVAGHHRRGRGHLRQVHRLLRQLTAARADATAA